METFQGNFSIFVRSLFFSSHLRELLLYSVIKQTLVLFPFDPLLELWVCENLTWCSHLCHTVREICFRLHGSHLCKDVIFLCLKALIVWVTRFSCPICVFQSYHLGIKCKSNKTNIYKYMRIIVIKIPWRSIFWLMVRWVHIYQRQYRRRHHHHHHHHHHQHHHFWKRGLSSTLS